MRAFLRLAHVDNEHNKAVLPKLLKKFYGYSGIMRNIQWQKHHVFEYITKRKADTPHQYLHVLEEEFGYWKKDALDLMADNNFDEVQEKIIKQLPEKITKAQKQKFVQQKLTTFADMIGNLEDETAIHTTRKILKDLLYTWDYTDDKSIFPKAISNKDELRSFTQQLGNFRDVCIQLELMHPEYLDKVHDEKEKKLLSGYYAALQREKKRITNNVLHSLIALHDELCQSEILLN